MLRLLLVTPGSIVEPTDPELAGHRGKVLEVLPGCVVVDWGLYGARRVFRPALNLRVLGLDPDDAAQDPESVAGRE